MNHTKNPLLRVFLCLNYGFIMKIRMIEEGAYERISAGNPEVLHKNRGYGVLFVQCFGLTFAIPLRSNMNHSHGFKTVKTKSGKSGKFVWNGVDYTKALVVLDSDLEKEAFKTRTTEEHNKIRRNSEKIEREFISYVQGYVDYVRSGDRTPPRKYAYTTLKYFHTELGL